MADISKLNFNGVTYNIKDETARSRVLPSGGSVGQVLVKNSNIEGDASWYTPGYFPTGDWYLPAGITQDKVIGAWQFVGRNTESEALYNINSETEYSLSKSDSDVVFNPAKGFYIPAGKNKGLDNSEIRNNYSNILSVAYGFSGLSTETGNKLAGGLTPYSRRMLVLRGVTEGSNYKNKFMISYGTNTYKPWTSASLYDNGVLGGSWSSSSSELFYNGVSQSLTSQQTNEWVYWRYTLFGQPEQSDASKILPFYVTALALYNVALSSYQQLELANNIRDLGGIE